MKQTTRGTSGYVFGQKRNFHNGQHVIISDIGDNQEYTGTIRGKSLDHIIDHYIVELSSDTKMRFKERDNQAFQWDCVALPESCLRSKED